MARKTKEDAEKTRQQIIQAALDVFYERGYSGSTLVDIAQKIGLTKGAIYWHFKSKVVLFLGLGQEMEDRVAAELKDLFNHVDSLEGAKEMSSKLMTLIGKDPQLNKYYSLVYYRMEWQEDLLPVMDFFSKQDEDFREYLMTVLHKSQEEGEIRSDIKLRSMAVTWLALFDGFLSRILMQKEDIDSLLQDFESGLDLFLNGVKQ